MCESKLWCLKYSYWKVKMLFIRYDLRECNFFKSKDPWLTQNPAILNEHSWCLWLIFFCPDTYLCPPNALESNKLDEKLAGDLKSDNLETMSLGHCANP